MWAALPAFLLEAVFYLGSVFAETRTWLARLRPVRVQAVFLWFSALVPYLIFSFGTNTFHLGAAVPPLVPGRRYACEFAIASVALGYGHYSIAVALHESDSHLVRNHDWWDQALVFQVLRADEPYRIGIANLPISKFDPRNSAAHPSQGETS